MNAAAQQLEECIQQLKRGELTEAAAAGTWAKPWRITGPDARVSSTCRPQPPPSPLTSSACSRSPDGQVSDGPFDPADWPYKTVLDAINAGWRVIRFPAQLLSSHSPDRHVTCEFILEKWE